MNKINLGKTDADGFTHTPTAIIENCFYVFFVLKMIVKSSHSFEADERTATQWAFELL